MGWHSDMTTINDLNATVKRYNNAVVRNNVYAVDHPEFAAKLAAMRSDGADVVAASQVRQAYRAYQMQGMGWQLAVIGGVAAVAIVTAISIMYMLIRREEQIFASENPIQAMFQSAMTGVWAVLGIGVIALGGLAYWDYRKGREHDVKTRRMARPFDVKMPEFGKTRPDKEFEEQMAEEAAIYDAVRQAELAEQAATRRQPAFRAGRPYRYRR